MPSFTARSMSLTTASGKSRSDTQWSPSISSGILGLPSRCPLLLSLMREFSKGAIKIKQLQRALKAIEDYHFTYNVLASKTSSGGMSMFYARKARDLLESEDQGKDHRGFCQRTPDQATDGR